jgi:hypothetical protein
MGQRASSWGAALAVIALTPLIGGCTDGKFDAYRMIGPYENHVTGSNANGVRIEYFGDVEATVPLARQRCAQYAKVPERVSNDSGVVTYLCRDPASAPGQLRG